MKKKRLLIADDDEMVRNLMLKALEDQNYDVEVVKNGIEALRRFEKTFYDLIITDYDMPEMNGLELIRKVRLKDPVIPILVITGKGPVDDLLESGATACLTKPVEILKLKNTIDRIFTLLRDSRA